jgi:nicotinamide-nucleotide amidase
MENPNAVKIEDFFSKVLSVIGKTTDAQIAETLMKGHKTISVAESLTGGMICSRLASISGSSNYFIGGIVCYNTRLKVTEVGVPAALISKHGVASREVAIAMAENIRKKYRTDIGLSATGFAGPAASPTEPVGLAYVALATEQGTEVRELRLQGVRTEVREKATQAALGLLWLKLSGEEL